MKQFRDPSDASGKVFGELTAIAKYFRKPDESLHEFQEQCKKLSPEDKTELAVGAAQMLGYEVV